MTTFATLEYDIKQMLQGNHSLESLELRSDTAHRIVGLAKNVATHTLEMMSHRPINAKSDTDKSVRMSELGEPCLRKLMYKWYSPTYGLPPFAEAPTPYLPVKFTYGDYIEELTLFLASEAGHVVKDRQKQVKIGPLSNGWYAVGHIDAVVDDTLVDVKSAADVSFNKYKREGLTEATDSFGYLYQLDAYAIATSNSNRAFLFTNKHDGEIHVIDRSGEPFMPVTAKLELIADVAEVYKADGILPDRLPTKSTKYGEQLGTICNYCNFKHTCYSGDISGVIVSGRPVYFAESTITSEGYAYIKDKAKIAKPENWTQKAA